MTDRNQAHAYKGYWLRLHDKAWLVTLNEFSDKPLYRAPSLEGAIRWIDAYRIGAVWAIQEKLPSPVLDYEEAARQAGWQTREEAEWAFTGGKFVHRKSTANDSAKTWEALCAEEGIEPYEWEIFEHWAVSEWFGRQLAAQGECVDFDFAGMVVWGRTTTGQGIAMDSVVLKIAAELMKEIV